MARTSPLYQITFLNEQGVQTVVTHVYQTKVAAIKFARHMSKQGWASDVTVWAGAPGGIRVGV